MQKGTDYRFGGGFEPHGPESQGPAVSREEDRDGNGLTARFVLWLHTFRSCMSAAIGQARQSRIDGLTKRCYRE